MTGLMADYGAAVLFVTAFLSCVLLPIPTSVLMMTAGGVVATGGLSLPGALLAPFAGAVLGDQAGYWLGRRKGAVLLARLSRRPARARAVARSRDLLDRYGGVGVFLTRWLFAPLGPSANFACGAAGVEWRHFTLPAVAGKALWVTLYTGTGHAFAGNIAVSGQVLGPVLGALAAAVAIWALARWLGPALRQQ